MVMLTRVSIKLRLAWSTVAQMGFMLVECAAGLSTSPPSTYSPLSVRKAHAFASSSIDNKHELRKCAASMQSGSPESGVGTLASLSLVFGYILSPGGMVYRLGCGGGILPCSLSPSRTAVVEHGSPVWLDAAVAHTVRGSLPVRLLHYCHSERLRCRVLPDQYRLLWL